MSRKIRQAKEKAKADSLKQRTLDRGRRERDAFAKRLATLKDGSNTTSSGIVDDEAVVEEGRGDDDRARARGADGAEGANLLKFP